MQRNDAEPVGEWPHSSAPFLSQPGLDPPQGILQETCNKP